VRGAAQPSPILWPTSTSSSSSLARASPASTADLATKRTAPEEEERKERTIEGAGEAVPASRRRLVLAHPQGRHVHTLTLLPQPHVRLRLTTWPALPPERGWLIYNGLYLRSVRMRDGWLARGCARGVCRNSRDHVPNIAIAGVRTWVGVIIKDRGLRAIYS
jgi:hypothetical protein